MALNVVLSHASPPYKYKVLISKNGRDKTVRFGAVGYQDYTKTGDDKAKQAYITRHRVREDWNNYNTSSIWAKNLLWNKPTLQASIKDVERRFDMNIKWAQLIFPFQKI